jgi:hypothetical protein
MNNPRIDPMRSRSWKLRITTYSLFGALVVAGAAPAMAYLKEVITTDHPDAGFPPLLLDFDRPYQLEIAPEETPVKMASAPGQNFPLATGSD